MSKESLLETCLEVYNLGVWCAKEVNSGREWTKAKAKRERTALNNIMKRHGATKLTDDEYTPFAE